MPKIQPFEKNVTRYEEWFEKNSLAYAAELRAIRALLPQAGDGVEIGVGTGRFAAPLGIKIGVEPARAMAEEARRRGIEVLEGVAEALPLADNQFDFALMVTTICFVDDVGKAFREAYRILKPGGCLILGFVDRESLLGKIYERNKEANVFYREARFYSVEELLSHLRRAGFKDFAFTQTIFHELKQIEEKEPVLDGYGQGSFVVVRAVKG